MALDFLSKKVGSVIWEKLGPITGINLDLEKLKSTLSQIEDLRVKAPLEKITSESIKKELDCFQRLAYDLEDVLDYLETEDVLLTEEPESRPRKIRRVISSYLPPSFSLSFRMRNLAADATSRIQDDKIKKALDWSKTFENQINVNRGETDLQDSFPIVGREEDKEKLMNELLQDEQYDQNFSIVPIIGIAGVGKTVLARLVYNEQKVIDHFDIMIWVWVLEKFDIFYITKIIYQNVTGQNRQPVENLDLNILQKSLRKEFSGKRILLVIDNVWCANF